MTIGRVGGVSGGLEFSRQVVKSETNGNNLPKGEDFKLAEGKTVSDSIKEVQNVKGFKIGPQAKVPSYDDTLFYQTKKGIEGFLSGTLKGGIIDIQA